MRSSGRGAAKFLITENQIEFLSRLGMTAPTMAEALNVSESTIR